MKNSKKNTLTLLKQIFTNKTVIVTLILTILLLVFFHIGSIFPAPGIQISGQFYNDGSSIAGMLNLLAGGGLSRMSIFAVGIGPYITAQIIVQLLSSDLIPPLSKLAKMGERGRRKLEILTRIITLPFCIAQSYAVLALLLNNNTSSIISIFGVNNYTGIGEIPAGQTFALILMFIDGTYIAIFLGDLITKRGVGNGVTLLILAGIVSSLIANFSTALQRIDQLMPPNSMHLTSTILSSMLYILFFIVILFCIVFINGATRKIPIQQTGQGLTNEIKTLPFLPIKLNPAGVIPVIFASSIMTIPGTIAQFLKQDSTRWFIEKYLIIESWSGLSMYFLFIILFSFFYAYVQVNPTQLSENFEKSGKFIPGVKVGEDTEKHITKVLNRINWIGAPFLGIVAVLPYIISMVTTIPGGLALGGTGLIIIVSGTLELWNSIKSAATTSGYNVTRTKIESKHFMDDIETDSKNTQLW